MRKKQEPAKDIPIEERCRLLSEENSNLKGKIKSLRTNFSRQFYNGRRNRIISARHGREIMIYLSTQQAAVERAKDINEKKEYPILYETNAKLLSKQFDISYYQAGETIKFLLEIGAWRYVQIKRDKIYVYQIGERRAAGKYKTSDGWVKQYKNFFHFSLYGNTVVKSYYKLAEISPMSKKVI